MSATVRARRYLLIAAAVALLLAPLCMPVHKVDSRPPLVPPVAKKQAPVFLPVTSRTVVPASTVVEVGERSPYIVQAASADMARSAVLKAGGVVTGDLSVIRAVGA